MCVCLRVSACVCAALICIFACLLLGSLHRFQQVVVTLTIVADPFYAVFYFVFLPVWFGLLVGVSSLACDVPVIKTLIIPFVANETKWRWPAVPSTPGPAVSGFTEPPGIESLNWQFWKKNFVEKITGCIIITILWRLSSFILYFRSIWVEAQPPQGNHCNTPLQTSLSQRTKESEESFKILPFFP